MNTDVHALIPLFVAIPLAMAMLIQIVARHRHAAAETLNILAMLALSVMSWYCIGEKGIYNLGGWPTPIGIDMRLDALATLPVSHNPEIRKKVMLGSDVAPPLTNFSQAVFASGQIACRPDRKITLETA